MRRLRSFASSITPLATALSACSTTASHTAADYKSATFSTTGVTAYREAGVDGEVVRLQGELHFVDKTSSHGYVTLAFAGPLTESSGQCVFKISDDREQRAKGTFDDEQVIRRCDGLHSEAFQLGDSHISIRGHIKANRFGSAFYTDAIDAPQPLNLRP